MRANKVANYHCFKGIKLAELLVYRRGHYAITDCMNEDCQLTSHEIMELTHKLQHM